MEHSDILMSFTSLFTVLCIQILLQNSHTHTHKETKHHYFITTLNWTPFKNFNILLIVNSRCDFVNYILFLFDFDVTPKATKREEYLFHDDVDDDDHGTSKRQNSHTLPYIRTKKKGNLRV